MEANKTTENCLGSQRNSFLIINAKTIYPIKSRPWGIPNNFTYEGSFNKYLMGVAINNSKIYETPSKKAVMRKMFKNETIRYSTKKIKMLQAY